MQNERIDVRANDTLANERTYLAYVRTALSFIAFGFVIARFSLFAQEFAEVIHSKAAPGNLSTGFGTGMALFGVVIAAIGAWRYVVTDRGLRQGRVAILSGTMATFISLAVIIIAAIIAFELLTYRVGG
jgi:putative membrane protein